MCKWRFSLLDARIKNQDTRLEVMGYTHKVGRLKGISWFMILLLVASACNRDDEFVHDPEIKLPVLKHKTFTNDGAWCWFSDPRAIYVSPNEIISGWVKTDGSVEVARLNFESETKRFEILYPEMQKDDHNNPAFAILPDNNIFSMYAWHGGKRGVISNTSSNGSHVNSFQGNKIFKPKTEALLEAFPNETYTYANPYVLSAEDNKLFAFGRWIGFKPNLIISEDNGQTWSDQYVVVSPEPFDRNNRPYAKYYSDGQSKIHMIFTDGHPRNEPSNGVYYCYYENGAFWKADGQMICTLAELPFQPEDASVLYSPTNYSGRAWICDIVEKDETPYVLYSRHPRETDHRYHYAWYNKGTNEWEDHEICKAGAWFPQTKPGVTEREPHYMGNMTFNPLKPAEIYVSREVNDVFEIEKFETSNGGVSWDITPITENSNFDNVRPYVPRYLKEGAKTVVLWMENRKYVHYTNYECRIKYHVEEL